jgi:hypothetical protein
VTVVFAMMALVAVMFVLAALFLRRGTSFSGIGVSIRTADSRDQGQTCNYSEQPDGFFHF